MSTRAHSRTGSLSRQSSAHGHGSERGGVRGWFSNLGSRGDRQPAQRPPRRQRGPPPAAYDNRRRDIAAELGFRAGGYEERGRTSTRGSRAPSIAGSRAPSAAGSRAPSKAGSRAPSQGSRAPSRAGSRAPSIVSRVMSRAGSEVLSSYVGSRPSSRAGSQVPMAFNVPSRYGSIAPSRAPSTVRPASSVYSGVVHTGTRGLRRSTRHLDPYARGDFSGLVSQSDTGHICAGCAAARGLPYRPGEMTTIRFCGGCHAPSAAYNTRRYEERS